MKIIVLTDHFNGTDGLSRYSLDIVEETQKRNNVLALVSERTNNDIEQKNILSSYRDYFDNLFRAIFIARRTARKANKIINDFSPDVIHFMGETYALILPFLKMKKPVKTVLTLHGTYSVIPVLYDRYIYKKIAEYYWNKVYNQIDMFVAVSNFTKKYFINHYPQLEKKVNIITNGINLNEHKIFDPKNRVKNKIKNIICVGAVKSRKGMLESITALKRYRDIISEKFKYTIIGSYDPNGPYVVKLKEFIKDNKMENNIVLAGRISHDELIGYYKTADLFLMLPITGGRFEGFGLVYLEANAKGVPCIGSKNCGAEDAIINRKTGYLVDPKNNKEVVEKIDKILNKNTIDLNACIDWARRNDVKNKALSIIDLYKK